MNQNWQVERVRYKGMSRFVRILLKMKCKIDVGHFLLHCIYVVKERKFKANGKFDRRSCGKAA